MGVDVWEVIDAASSKPFGYLLFYPGPGVGGHCIPLDPYYLASKARDRESPALKIIQLLRDSGADVSYNDPYVSVISIKGDTLTSIVLSEECLAGADCVVISTDHSDYDYQYITAKSSLVFDARGVTRGQIANHITRL